MRAAFCVWLALLAVGCAPEAEPDAYGNVEAVDVVVGEIAQAWTRRAAHGKRGEAAEKAAD